MYEEQPLKEEGSQTARADVLAILEKWGVQHDKADSLCSYAESRGFSMGACWTDEGDPSLAFERDEVVYSVYDSDDRPGFLEVAKFTRRTDVIIGIYPPSSLSDRLPLVML